MKMSEMVAEPDITTDGEITLIVPASNEVADKAALASALRNKIMGIKDEALELVVIPEWDNVVLEFHSLTGAEKSEWLALLDLSGKDSDSLTNAEKAKRLQLFVELAVHTAYYPSSDIKIFETKDAVWLLGKSAKALSRLEDSVGKLNGFVKDDKPTSQESVKNS